MLGHLWLGWLESWWMTGLVPPIATMPGIG